MLVGRKSTLFLAYAYTFGDDGETLLSKEAEKGSRWKPRAIKGAALLPHLDEYVKKGALLRAYETAGDLRAAFGSKDAWQLTDGEDTALVTIVDPPRVYTLDTKIVFIVMGVAPKADELTLAAFQDTAYRIVRTGTSKVKAIPPQMQKQTKLTETLTLRAWLARLVPGLTPDAPRGTPRTTSPALISVILPNEAIGREDLHRLRLVHRSNQFVEPSEPSEGKEPGVWHVSSREVCMFSSFGFTWVATDHQSSQFLADAPAMIRDRYIHKWLLVEHQRLCLLALATECADMSKGLDGGGFDEMRMRLLSFIATYNFRHVSNEERHDRFYLRARDSLAIDDLLAEVREEIVEIDTQLAARRAETLNYVIAFLTLVLTPITLVVGVFQTDTLPGRFRLGHLVSLSAWGTLLTHPPFLVVVTAAVVGATVYVRLFGFSVVAQMLRKLVSRRGS